MFQEINSNDIYTKLGYTNIYQFTKTERETIENQLSKHPYIHYRYNSAFIYYVSATYDSGIKLQDDEMTICLPDDLILHNEGEEILLNREILEKENNFKMGSYTLVVDFLAKDGRRAVLHINKGHDEWYFVEYPRIRKSYQCDQIDGLISFLISVINHNI